MGPLLSGCAAAMPGGGGVGSEMLSHRGPFHGTEDSVIEALVIALRFPVSINIP